MGAGFRCRGSAQTRSSPVSTSTPIRRRSSSWSTTSTGITGSFGTSTVGLRAAIS
ncbi:hypothetical protein MUK42_03520 [Musa troglodytarum]|uniref:Uncharacterized protein n=1 Tax=Musa troglodytarum TaxID=320322 RepID=A0A9E7KSH1_9LILI|nr:hypothetical protein MUK42_03520 [Musa troglodytarum]